MESLAAWLPVAGCHLDKVPGVAHEVRCAALNTFPVYQQYQCCDTGSLVSNGFEHSDAQSNCFCTYSSIILDQLVILFTVRLLLFARQMLRQMLLCKEVYGLECADRARNPRSPVLTPRPRCKYALRAYRWHHRRHVCLRYWHRTCERFWLLRHRVNSASLNPCCVNKMPLNPFAREYVPTVGKQTSLLNVSYPATSHSTTQKPASPQPVLLTEGTQPVGSVRCPTPAAEALEDEELQFEDVFEVETSAPSPRSHLSPASPGGLSMVYKHSV